MHSGFKFIDGVYALCWARWQIIELPDWADKFDDGFNSIEIEVENFNKVPIEFRTYLEYEDLGESKIFSAPLSDEFCFALSTQESNKEGYPLAYIEWVYIDAFTTEKDANKYWEENKNKFQNCDRFKVFAMGLLKSVEGED